MPASLHVLLSGASGGLGRNVLDILLQEGHQVTALVHRTSSLRDMEQRNLDASRLQFYEVDLSQAQDVDRLIQRMPLPDTLVHLAGGFRPHKNLGDSTLDDYDYLMNLNLKGAYLLVKALLGPMKQRGSGSIVAIGAKSVLHPGKEHALYAASKAALHSLILHAAEEGRPHGVRANLIVPQIIRTETNLKWSNRPGEADRWTPPEDIAQCISWLISQEAAGITGAVLPMYGQLPG